MASLWPLLPMALLLLASVGTGADLQKAKVSLNPKWDRLLQEDSVTLTCQGAHAEGDDATRWWHKEQLLPDRSSSFSIASALVNDSGEYRCQTSRSNRSDPVRLQVSAAWLQLQAERWVFKEGEPITLRCHVWRNHNVFQLQYFQNGRGQQFTYKNSNFHIPKATSKHNGSYFCRGIIGTVNTSSEAVVVTVEAFPPGLTTSPFSLKNLVLVYLVLSLMFALDTGLYFSVRRDLQRSLKNRRNDNFVKEQEE